MFDGAVAAQKAMSALLRTSGRFFPGHLANILIGKVTDAMRRHSHDALPTFGVGSEFDAAGWRSIFRQLQAAGLIAQDSERWGVTEAGRAVLRGEASLDLVAIEGAGGRAGRARRMLGAFAQDEGSGNRRDGPQVAVAEDEDALSTADERLLAALKAERLVLARAGKVPAYVVSTDKTLREIARSRPRDAAALVALRGVGPAKARTYGGALLAVIARHRN